MHKLAHSLFEHRFDSVVVDCERLLSYVIFSNNEMLSVVWVVERDEVGLQKPLNKCVHYEEVLKSDYDCLEGLGFEAQLDDDQLPFDFQ